MHGDSTGALSPSLRILDEDIERWSGVGNVKVVDVRGLSYSQIYSLVSGEGDIVCGWCWSGAHPAVQTAIAAGVK